jgi:hypothetical protein
MMPDEEITRDVRYVLDDPEVRVVEQTLDSRFFLRSQCLSTFTV